MKIVDLQTFLTLPAGTVYAKYQPCAFGDLAIKDDSMAPTWCYVDFTPWFESTNDSGEWIDALDAIGRGAPSPPLDLHTTTKDGLYDRDQLFAVWERDDVDRLIARLQEARAEAYSEASVGDVPRGTPD